MPDAPDHFRMALSETPGVEWRGALVRRGSRVQLAHVLKRRYFRTGDMTRGEAIALARSIYELAKQLPE